MINLLTIEDSTIRAMLNDPRIVELLPCLNTTKQQLQSVQKGGKLCGRCARDKKHVTGEAFRAAKQCIKDVRGQRLTQLKSFLGARQLRVVVRNAAGKGVHITL